MNRIIYSPRLTRVFYYGFVVLMFLSGYYVFPAKADNDLTLNLNGNKQIRAALLSLETFTRQADWEEYSSPKGVQLGIENGVYRMSTINQGYVWGLNKEQHDNVVLEVEVTPMSPDATANAYGVMCRADESNNGDGYYFMIKGDGYYSISMGQGDDIKPLVEWKASRAIHTGIDKNRMRAVCVDDVLALYVNDKLLIETQDGTYTTGYAGLAIAASPKTGADVIFDNLATYKVTNP
ncbi:MAG: hypothetical protein GC179_17055 [Anaerolineaceae bacterium]|nr:hypothetical protein [Anaerolineaceae bacterium]